MNRHTGKPVPGRLPMVDDPLYFRPGGMGIGLPPQDEPACYHCGSLNLHADSADITTYGGDIVRRDRWIICWACDTVQRYPLDVEHWEWLRRNRA